MEFYYGRSAHKHKIGKAHAVAAIEAAGIPLEAWEGVYRGVVVIYYRWVSADDRGLELEILGHTAVEDCHKIILYHVMPTNLREM